MRRGGGRLKYFLLGWLHGFPVDKWMFGTSRRNQFEKRKKIPTLKSCLERVRQLDVDMVKKGNKLAHLALVTDFFAPSHTRMQLHIIC